MSTCRLDKEDRAFLSGLPDVPQSFRAFGRPAEIPVDWHHTEDQRRMGSCQANDATSCLERGVYVGTRQKVQLSRIYTYLRTQQLDGLLGADKGSTISGGGKVLLEGVPLESLTGYPETYPGAAERQRVLQVGHLDYKALEVKACPKGAEACLDVIGGGGSISFGIPWYSGLIPADRVVRDFNPPGRAGGHAMAAIWYPTNGNIGAVNSHGDGPYEITPQAWAKMQAHPWTAMIVVLGAPGPVDWLEGYL